MDSAKSHQDELRIVETKIREVLEMMNQDLACGEVVARLSTIRSTVDHLIAQVIGTQLNQCLAVEGNSEESVDTAIQEALQLLLKIR